MKKGAVGDAVWYGPPESWPTEHCRVLYIISKYAQQARNVQSKESWIRQVALLVLLYEGIDTGVLPFDYSPSLIWLTFKRHIDRKWLRISQEAKSVIDDLWEAKLVNGIKLSSVDYQPVTAYQASFHGLSIVERIPEHLKEDTNMLLYAPIAYSSSSERGAVPPPAGQLLHVRYDGSDFYLESSDQSYSKKSTITDCEDVSYVSSPYIPSCLRSCTSFLAEPTSNRLRARESAHGYNMMMKEAKQSITLSQVHALVGEWLPFGANQISALSERLGAMERCQGGLFSSKLDLQPTETHFEVTPGLTQVKILDFDTIRFINFEAEINFPESKGVIQIENFGMHLHVSGAVLYGVKIDAIMNHMEDDIPFDLLARLLVDVHQDSSGIIHDLLSRYQLSVLDMLFMGKADQRNKFNLITAAAIEPKLPACKYLDNGERENELKQVLGKIYACHDITQDDVLFLGRDGCLLSGPGATQYESLLTTYMGLNSREIFIRNFFVRTFVLSDTLEKLSACIRTYRKCGEHNLKAVKKSLSDAARHMIQLIECLQYLLESAEALELPPVPVDHAGSKIYKCLQLLEHKNNVIVRCKDSIKLIERLRTQLDTLVTKFEGISRLQLTHVSQGFEINIRRLTESLRVRDELERNFNIIGIIFAGNLSFDIIDRLSGGTFNVPNPKWFIDWIKKPIIDTPFAFLIINLLWFAIIWMALQAWLMHRVVRNGATLVIRAHTDKSINLTQLRRLLQKRNVRLGVLEYEPGGRPELQSYKWEEYGFPSNDSLTHVQIIVDEKQKLLRSIRLQIACPLDESVPIHSRRLSMQNVQSSSMSRRTSRRLHPAPSSVTVVENNILEQFSTILRKEGVYQERHAPLARLGSQVNLLDLTKDPADRNYNRDASRIRRRGAVNTAHVFSENYT